MMQGFTGNTTRARPVVLGLLLALGLSAPLLARSAPVTLDAALAAPLRSAGNRARDGARHPRETLQFFGLKPNQTVLEVWPGNGWYMEILAPYLRASGHLYEALPYGPEVTQAGADPAAAGAARRFRQKLAEVPGAYDRVGLLALAPPRHIELRPPGGADLVLTFRNIHDWMKTGTAEQSFAAFFAALKPGGVLGVVEHRAEPGTTLQQMIDSGYVTKAYVVQLAQAAGFRLAGESGINANPKDDHQHPHGVWSLPPTFADGAATRATYQAIGESDRMTLKFVKPH